MSDRKDLLPVVSYEVAHRLSKLSGEDPDFYDGYLDRLSLENVLLAKWIGTLSVEKDELTLDLLPAYIYALLSEQAKIYKLDLPRVTSDVLDSVIKQAADRKKIESLLSRLAEDNLHVKNNIIHFERYRKDRSLSAYTGFIFYRSLERQEELNVGYDKNPVYWGIQRLMNIAIREEDFELAAECKRKLAGNLNIIE